MNALLRERVLVMDGAMGTMIQNLNLVESDYRGDLFADHDCELKGNNDLLSLTRPDAILDIHRAYLEAGADLVSTNTFNANRISQADYGIKEQCRELHRASAQLVRRACDEFETPERPRFAVGSLGPTNKTLSLSPDVENPALRALTFDEAYAGYEEAARGLIEGGADLLLLETIFDTHMAKAALMAIEDVRRELGAVPLMISVTVTDKSMRTLSGQTIEAFWTSVEHAAPFSVGLNCSFGARDIRPALVELETLAPTWVSVHPNAGLPNALGGYDDSPEIMAGLIREFVDSGLANLVGGCCGSSPAHIAAIARAMEGATPRPLPHPVPAADRITRFSGLETEAFHPDSSFFMIGERLNVAGSRRFARLIREEKFEAALKIARQQVEGGANMLDLNMDDPLLDAPAAMDHFLRLMAAEPEIARLPVMIDSSRWEVLEIGLKGLQGKGVVNSLSLKDGEEEFLRRARLVHRYGAAAVIMAFDERGQADTADRKVEIMERAYGLLVDQAGFPACDIIMDINVLAVATGLDEHRDYAIHFIEAVKRLKVSCPGARFSGGISNLSFAFRGNDVVREAMHAAFLYRAIEAGLDMGIVNAGQLAVYEDIEPHLLERVEDVLWNRRDDATERLIEFATTVKGEGAKQIENLAWREGDLSARLAHALVHGILDYLAEDLEQALTVYDLPLTIVEGPLMDGMRTVGKLFGEGKMFLPQIVKSARAMKRAVEILDPYLKQDQVGAASRGRILLATVKGDVHDIGKNIVSVVLGCNGYEIIDLGVMVPTPVIIDKATELKPDIVGLSGLITPSLDEMTEVAREMNRRGLVMPLLVGGATTSPEHTALRIAPEYEHGVIQVKDASRAASTVGDLLNRDTRQDYLEEVARKQRGLRERAEARIPKPLLSIEEARSNRALLDFGGIAKPPFCGRRMVATPLAELVELIDWTFFFKTWELKGRYPEVLSHPERGAAARDLVADARTLLAEIVENNLLEARGVYGFWPAAAEGDDVILYTAESRTTEMTRFPLLRQQTTHAAAKPNRCLSDYISPVGGAPDWMGGFALTAGLGAAEAEARFRAEGDDYRAIMIRALADRLAEAQAEHLHRQICVDLGLPADSGIRPAIGYPSCPDHTEKFRLFELLTAGEAGISLTETAAMIPAASVSGLYFIHPEARYFNVGNLGRDQVMDYAERKGGSVADSERQLARHLNYLPDAE
ncbi:MAG: methionine synthase [bacterium]|nr:methionine synthase [bacterium]